MPRGAEHQLFAGVESVAKGLIGGGDLLRAGLAGNRTSSRSQVPFQLSVTRHALLPRQFRRLPYAAEARARRLNNEFQAGRFAVAFALVIGVAIDFAEAGHFETQAELERFIRQANAGAAGCGAD